MSEPNNETLFQEVAARAARDMTFRRRLLTSPEAAVYEAFGAPLPKGHRVRFVEKPPGVDTLIVLPDFTGAGAELDDDDLSAAAGGDGGNDGMW